MEDKSSSQVGAFFYPMFANYVHAKRCWPNCSRLLTWKYFLPNFSKIAVEYDWNIKIFQNVQNLGIFGKIDGFFFKKTLNLFKIVKFGSFL